jgi:predicted RecA/RadA family phage recombinase
MATATFIHGSPVMLDHKPVSEIAAGDLVVVGDEIRIAHQAITANALGALAAPSGNAVYRVPKATGASTAIAAGKRVWWNAGSAVVTETQSTHKPLGITVAAAGDSDASVLVRHCYFSVES